MVGFFESWFLKRAIERAAKATGKLVLGTDTERALARCVRIAVGRTSQQLCSTDSDAESLELTLNEALESPFASTAEADTLLAALAAGVEAALSPLADPTVTGHDRSALELLELDYHHLARTLFEELLRAIDLEAATAGEELGWIASQLNNERNRYGIEQLAQRLDALGAQRQALHELQTRIPHAALETSRLAQPERFNLAPNPGPGFVERQELAERIMGSLTGSGSDAVALASTAVHGTGGFGKTELAAWIAHRPDTTATFPDGVLWAELGRDPGEHRIAAFLRDFVHHVTGHRPDFETVPSLAQQLAAALQDRRVLVVVDDVWDQGDLQPFLVGGPGCGHLVTSRRSDVVPRGTDTIAVDLMSPSEASAVLSRGVDLERPDQLTELQAQTGRWPLLLSLLNGVLVSMLDRFGKSIDETVTDLIALLRGRGISAIDDLTSDLDRTVAGTLELSIEELAGSRGATAETRFAQLGAFEEGHLISYRHLQLLWKLGDIETRTICQTLADRSLLAEISGNGIRLHDVVLDHLQTTRLDVIEAGSSAFVDALAAEHGTLAGIASSQNDADSLAYHLARAGRSTELLELVTDMRYLAQRLQTAGPTATAHDLAIAATTSERDPALQALQKVLRLEGHLFISLNAIADHGATLESRFIGGPAEPRITGRDSLLADSLRCAHPMPDGPDERLRSVLVGHTDIVNAVAWRPDGGQLATASHDGTIRLWNPNNGNLDELVDLNAGPVSALDWTPDGIHVVAGTYDGRLSLIDPTYGTELNSATFYGEIRAIKTAPAGGVVAVGTDAPSLELLQIPSLKTHRTISVSATPRMIDWRTGAPAVAGMSAGEIVAFDIDDQPPNNREELISGVRAVAWHPEASMLAIGGIGHRVLLLDHTLDVIAASPERESGATDLAWSSDGELLATCHNGGAVELWTTNHDTETGVGAVVLDDDAADWHTRFHQLPHIDTRGVQARAAEFRPRTNQLAVATHSPVVRLWDDLDRPARDLGDGRVNCVQFSPDNSKLLLGDADGRVQLIDATNPFHRWTRHGHQGDVRAVAWHPNSRYAVSLGDDGTLVHWEFTDDGPVLPLGAPNGGAMPFTVEWAGSLLWTADGRHLIVGSHNRIDIVDPTEGVSLRHFAVDGIVNGMALSPAQTHLAGATAASELTIVDLTTGDVTTHAGHDSTINAVAWTGQTILTGGYDGRVLSWSWPALTARLVDVGTDAVWDVTASTRDELFATVTAGGRVQLRTASPTAPLRSEIQVDSALSSCHVSANGDNLALAGAAGVYLFTIPQAAAGATKFPI